ncbi:hypothetical protein Q8F55_002861 [Vanrija albida]|uniref:Arrestin C-terminal-like domain-containing protein n=1 Tax=Vanrija albida TaxID=181172 RepID=A0ABR3QAX6_9TREE
MSTAAAPPAAPAAPVASTAPAFGLRPTHNLSPARANGFPSFSGFTQPVAQKYAPAASSPLKPRPQNRNSAYDDAPSDGDVFSDRLSTGEWEIASPNKDIRHSRSSEWLKRISRSTGNTASTESDDEDEKLRLPADHPRNTGNEVVRSPSGAAKGLTTITSPSNTSLTPRTEDSYAGQFPPPPTMPSGYSPAAVQQQAYANGQAANPSPQRHSAPPPPRPQPWPAQASPKQTSPEVEQSRLSDPLIDPFGVQHSRNSALLAASTGGMVMLPPSGGNYQLGKGPGEEGSKKRRPQSYVPPRTSQASSSHSAQPDFSRATSRPWTNSPSPVEGSASPTTSNSHTREAPKRRGHVRRHSDGDVLLSRQGTLFHPAADEARSAQELEVMLGKPRSRRLSANRLLPAPDAPYEDKVRLEASKKSKARVELDVVLERECVIEGGELRGRLEVVVRGGKRTKDLRVGAGKIRVLGFEEMPGHGSSTVRHIFYQHQYYLPVFQDNANGPRSSLFGSGTDEEGFRLANEGTHAIPFSVPLPLGGGAKGAYSTPGGKGPTIRYVVVASVKLHIPTKNKRAIAHFYRPVVILPYHNPAVALGPLRSPLFAQTTGTLGWALGGEKGRVNLVATLGRQIWVAGQRVWAEITVENNSNKKITKYSAAIIQTVETWGVGVKGGKPTISTARNKISEETVEADFMDVGSGHVTGKGWWTGLEPGESNRWDISVPIPTGYLSIPRSRFIEVSYVLRVTINNNIYVDVPLELINFLSVDPPPMPSDVRRAMNRLPVVTKSPLPAGAAVPIAGPPRENQVYGVDALGISYVRQHVRDDSAGNMSAARTSSTTLHIDNIAGPLATVQSGYAGADLSPRPPSPGSTYSNERGAASAVPSLTRAKQLTAEHRTLSESGHSIDDEERNHVAVEANRREGRQQSLAALEADEDETEWLSTRNSSSTQDANSSGSHEDRSKAADGFHDAENRGEHDDAEESGEKTPVVTPTPAFRSNFLPHISEAEEEDDDMLEEVMSSVNGDNLAGKFYDDDDRDEMSSDLAPQTPTLHRQSPLLDLPSPRLAQDEAPPRRSLEDRLASAVGRPLPASPVTSTSTHGGHLVPPELPAARERERPKSVDYAEPIYIGDLNQEFDHDPGYDADIMSEGHSTVGGLPSPRSFGGRREGMKHSLSLPLASARDAVPLLPSPGSARDIHWGPQFRSVSGVSASNLWVDVEPSVKSPSAMTFGAQSQPNSQPSSWSGHSPNAPQQATMAQGPEVPTESHLHRDHEHRNLSAMATEIQRDNEMRNLAAAAAGDNEDYGSEEELAPPNLTGLRSVFTGSSGNASSSVQSFVTAHSGPAEEDQDMPPLAPASESASSDDHATIESPTIPSAPTYSSTPPVYTLPLPAPPDGTKRSSMTVPDRFRPAPPPAPLSEDSHDSHYAPSMASTAHGSEVLPNIKNKIAALESREDALRKFTVASSIGLEPPTPPAASSATPVSKRRSYTAALGSPRSGALSPRSPGPRQTRSPQFGLDELSDASTSAYVARHVYAESIDMAALSTPTTPTGPKWQHRAAPSWDNSTSEDISSSASKLLSRALSSSSTRTTSTTATDVELALSSPGRSPVIGPRGPRQPGWTKTGVASTALAALAAESYGSDSKGPEPSFSIPRPSYSPSPGQTPTKAPSPLPLINSESASLESVSMMSHGLHPAVTEPLSAQSTGSNSFGNTGWNGGSMRLPPLGGVVGGRSPNWTEMDSDVQKKRIP